MIIASEFSHSTIKYRLYNIAKKEAKSQFDRDTLLMQLSEVKCIDSQLHIYIFLAGLNEVQDLL